MLLAKGCGGDLGAGSASTSFIWLCGLVEYTVRQSIQEDNRLGYVSISLE